MQQASDYRNELIQYMKSVGGFDYLMFTRKPIDEYLTVRELIELRDARGEQAAKDAAEYKAGSLDLSDMPRFIYLPVGLSTSLAQIFPELLIMIFLNILFFSLSWVSFLRADIR